MGREVVSAVRRRRLNPEFDAPAGTNAAAAAVPLPLVPGRKMAAMSTPATTAAVTPPAAAVSPPVKMPIQPSEATASRTPASVWPKPVRGTVAPAPPTLGQGLIQPQGTEQHAHYHVSVRMRAGVS